MQRVIPDIKNGMPVPTRSPRKVWPYEDMGVGEYFEVRLSEVKPGSLNVANWRAGKRLGRRFAYRVDGQVIRVWRVA